MTEAMPSPRICCGIDVVDMQRFSKVIERSGRSFLRRVFTEGEIAYADRYSRSRDQHLAARFAAKEAVVKAVSQLIGDPSLSLKSIEIKVDAIGRPAVAIQDSRLEHVAIEISLSHVQTVAVANAVAWKTA